MTNTLHLAQTHMEEHNSCYGIKEVKEYFIPNLQRMINKIIKTHSKYMIVVEAKMHMGLLLF